MSKKDILDKVTDKIELYVGDDYSVAYDVAYRLEEKKIKLADKQKNDLVEFLSDLDIVSDEVYLEHGQDSSFTNGIRYDTCHKKVGYLIGLYELSVEEFCDFLDISSDMSEEEFSEECQHFLEKTLESSKIVFENAYEELDKKLKEFLVDNELLAE